MASTEAMTPNALAAPIVCPNIDLIELQKKLEQLQPGKEPADRTALVHDLLETTLPGFEKDLRELQKNLETAPPAPGASARKLGGALA